IFQFHYAKLVNNDISAKTGASILENCIEGINNGQYNYPTYCNGICGFGWAINYLYKNDFVNLEIEESLLQIDTFLYKTMLSNIEKEDYDFLHGTLGYGLYFLNRYENTKLDTLKVQFKQCLDEVISFLKNLSEKHNNNSLKWISIINSETSQKGYNLSLSHGISSIVNFLSRLYRHDEFKSQIEDMLKEGVNYLLSFKNPNKKSFSL